MGRWWWGDDRRLWVYHFPARDHGAEVVPAREDYLDDMDHEKDAIADGEDKVDDARRGIPAEGRGEPPKLNGFIDRQPGENGAESHDNDAGVGDLLRPVEFGLGWGGLS